MQAFPGRYRDGGNSMPRLPSAQKTLTGIAHAIVRLTRPLQRCGMAKTGGLERKPSQSRWRAPVADKTNDPVAMWQNMIGEMEKGFNSFANQAMASPEFSKVMNQVGGVTANAQKQLGEMMEKY